MAELSWVGTKRKKFTDSSFGQPSDEGSRIHTEDTLGRVCVCVCVRVCVCRWVAVALAFAQISGLPAGGSSSLLILVRGTQLQILDGTKTFCGSAESLVLYCTGTLRSNMAGRSTVTGLVTVHVASSPHVGLCDQQDSPTCTGGGQKIHGHDAPKKNLLSVGFSIWTLVRIATFGTLLVLGTCRFYADISLGARERESKQVRPVPDVVPDTRISLPYHVRRVFACCPGAVSLGGGVLGNYQWAGQGNHTGQKKSDEGATALS